MAVRIVDHSAAFVHAINAKLADNLDKAATLLRAEVEYKIGIQGPPRSAPGESPHRDTGALQESFTTQLDASDLVARVGTDIPYSVDLEIGIGVAPRPFFLKTLVEQSDAIARLICKP